MNDCVFCNLDESRIEIENDLALSFKDLYPVTNGHTLVIPKRKVQSFFDLTEEETAAMFELLHLQKEDLKNKDSSITGFNIGVNDGEDAGQTIMHCHIHLIPRRKNDVENPRGGVRGVIKNKQNCLYFNLFPN